jgi:anti-sigma28 factor (negative regulator of flagellin synthesis)
MNKQFYTNIYKGIITPYRWQDNKVVEISIQTIDEEEYIVDHNDISKDMIQFINYPVEVSGVIKQRKSDGKYTIDVKKCVAVITSNEDVFI